MCGPLTDSPCSLTVSRQNSVLMYANWLTVLMAQLHMLAPAGDRSGNVGHSSYSNVLVGWFRFGAAVCLRSGSPSQSSCAQFHTYPRSVWALCLWCVECYTTMLTWCLSQSSQWAIGQCQDETHRRYRRLMGKCTTSFWWTCANAIPLLNSTDYSAPLSF